MIIRPMLPTEIDQVDWLAQLIWSHNGLAEPIRPELEDMFSNARFRPTFLVVQVGRDEGGWWSGELVGLGMWNHSWAHYDFFVLGWGGVHPAYRHRGLGRLLVEERLKDIQRKEPNAKVAMLATSHIAMYERYGFKCVGGVYGFRNSPTDMLMVKRLDQP